MRGQVTGGDGREEDPDNYLLQRHSTPDDGLNLLSTLGEYNGAGQRRLAATTRLSLWKLMMNDVIIQGFEDFYHFVPRLSRGSRSPLTRRSPSAFLVVFGISSHCHCFFDEEYVLRSTFDGDKMDFFISKYHLLVNKNNTFS